MSVWWKWKLNMGSICFAIDYFFKKQVWLGYQYEIMSSYYLCDKQNWLVAFGVTVNSLCVGVVIGSMGEVWMRRIIMARLHCIGVQFGVLSRLRSFCSKRVFEWMLLIWMDIRFRLIWLFFPLYSGYHFRFEMMDLAMWVVSVTYPSASLCSLLVLLAYSSYSRGL